MPDQFSITLQIAIRACRETDLTDPEWFGLLTEYRLAGWALFVVCSILFGISGVRANDALLVIASGAFLVGCLVFIAPLLNATLKGRKRRPKSRDHD